jgi:hypothetical protein
MAATGSAPARAAESVTPICVSAKSSKRISTL